MQDRELSEIIDRCRAIAAEEAVVTDHVDEPSQGFVIGVVGSAAHGKSALINVLAGREVLLPGISTTRPVLVEAGDDCLIDPEAGGALSYSPEALQGALGSGASSMLTVRRSKLLLSEGLRLLEMPAGQICSADEVDAYLLVLDAGRIGGEEEWRVLESLDTRRPLICVVSKIDLWPQAWRRAAALVSEQMAQTRGHEEPRVLGVCLLPEAATDSPQESMRYAVAELCRSESARAGSLQRRAARLANSVSASVEARLAESRADLSAAQDLIQHLQGEHVRLQTSIEELLRDADQVQDAILARAETALNRFAAGTLADALPGGAISGHPEQIEELLSRRMHDTWETVAEDAMTSYEAFVDLCAQRLSKLGWEWEAIGELGRAEWPGNAPTEPVHLKAGPRLSFSAKPRTSDFIRGGVLATVAAFVLPAPFKIIGTRLTSLLAALGAGAAATSLSAGQHESFASSVRNTIEQVSADLATHVKAELAKQFLCLKTALRDAAAEPVDVVRQKLAEAQLALAELEPGLSAAIQQGTERLSELTALSTRVDSMTGGART